MVKELWGFGLLVCNDMKGKPCSIGDVVHIERDLSPNVTIDHTGILVLRKHRGVCIETANHSYIPIFGEKQAEPYWRITKQ